MIEWLVENWWVLALFVLLLLTKVNRHAETRKKKKVEDSVCDAEEVVRKTVAAIAEAVPDRQERDKVLNGICQQVSGSNVFRRALIDGVIGVLEEGEKKEFTSVEGSHFLDQLSGRAVEAEKKRAKVKRGLKKAGVVVLKVVRGGLL